MEELTENAEEPDEGESKQSEQKLGKLQYKVCTHQSATTEMEVSPKYLFIAARVRFQLEQFNCYRNPS